MPSSIYQRAHNFTLQTLDGTTQIDHIFVSRFGIFVVETKYMQGWIFGSERQEQWTQKIYKKSFRSQTHSGRTTNMLKRWRHCLM
ncbi:nuclease-related domain-containing protein [Microbulbifer elongatus]|uniref:nuclease-related domain-containing protein n=1 Tax=Microbulbifer elongatus TaxID=86173 RepID=UPI0034E2080B